MTVANRGAGEFAIDLRDKEGEYSDVFAANELCSARCSALVRVCLDRLPIHLHSKCRRDSRTQHLRRNVRVFAKVYIGKGKESRDEASRDLRRT